MAAIVPLPRAQLCCICSEEVTPARPAVGHELPGQWSHAAHVACIRRWVVHAGPVIGCPVCRMGFAPASVLAAIARPPEEVLRGIVSADNASPEVMGNALIEAARHGQSEVVQALIEHPRFRVITPEHLGAASMYAMLLESIDIAERFIRCGRFGEIPVRYLESAFVGASFYGRTSSVRLLISQDRFAELSGATLGVALNNAAALEYFDIMQAIVLTGRVHEIPDDLYWSSVERARVGRDPRMLRLFWPMRCGCSVQ